MKRHPNLTYLFVLLVDGIATIIFVTSLLTPEHYTMTTWTSFGLWTVILTVVRQGGFFKWVGQKSVMIGWANAIEFAAIFILPFKLFCIAMLVSVIFIFKGRVKEKHPEPFLGPDFNVANIIISGFISLQIFQFCMSVFSPYLFAPTFSLLMSTLVYMVVSVLLLTTLIMIDLKTSWLQVGTLKKDSLITSAILVLIGALIGYIYNIDPFIIILVLLPMYFLHNLLQKVNQSKLVYIDEKTGLYNYRFFDESLSKMYHRAKKAQTSLSLIFGDMDFLRDINNNYGHPVGDEAITAVANVFSSICNPDSVAARFGGEEFVVLLPHDKQTAQKMAEMIRKGVKEKKLHLETGDDLGLTISLGIASYPEDCNTIEELVKASDNALYLAKNLGRDQIQVYHPGIEDDLFKSKAF